jgi:hypothetical protein
MPEILPVDNAFCTVKDVRDYVKGDVGSGGDLPTGADDIIQADINFFSTRFEGTHWANFETLLTERTRFLDGGKHTIFLPSVPIQLSNDAIPVPLIEVWEDQSRAFDDACKLVWNEDYTVDLKTGMLSCIDGIFDPGQMVVKVVWTAGLVIPADPPDLPEAIAPEILRNPCMRQVATWYRRRNLGDTSSASFGGGGSMDFVTLPDGTKLLPDVWHSIMALRRYA